MSPPVRVLGPTEEQGSYPNTYKEEEGSQGFSLMGFLLGRKPGEGIISPTGGLPQGPGSVQCLCLGCLLPFQEEASVWGQQDSGASTPGAQKGKGLCIQELALGEPLEG